MPAFLLRSMCLPRSSYIMYIPYFTAHFPLQSGYFHFTIRSLSLSEIPTFQVKCVALYES